MLAGRQGWHSQSADSRTVCGNSQLSTVARCIDYVPVRTQACQPTLHAASQVLLLLVLLNNKVSAQLVFSHTHETHTHTHTHETTQSM